MGHITNQDVFRIIDRGGEVSGYSRNFWGGRPSDYFSANRGYIPKKVAASLDALADNLGGYEAVIYSYGTPIAFKIAGTWLAPAVRYSTTTSTQHQANLGNVHWVPWDASLEELESIIDGYIVYDRHRNRYVKGRKNRGDAE